MKTYLGDGLYCEFDGYHFVLYTQEGNKVFLDSQCLGNFNDFVKRVQDASKNKQVEI